VGYDRRGARTYPRHRPLNSRAGSCPALSQTPRIPQDILPLGSPSGTKPTRYREGRRRQWIPHQERPSEIKKPPSARDRWGRRGDTHVETLSTTRSRGNRASRHKWRDWHQGRSRMKCQSCQQCHLCIQEGGRGGATGTPQSSCNGLVAASQGHPLPSIGEDAVSPCVLRSGDPSP